MLGEVLICERELDNTKHRYTVALLLNSKRCRYPEIFQRHTINRKIIKTMGIILKVWLENICEWYKT